jgi:hypothetical protein
MAGLVMQAGKLFVGHQVWLECNVGTVAMGSAFFFKVHVPADAMLPQSA